MKHIKFFEKVDRPKIGDYVNIRPYRFVDKISRNAKIISIDQMVWYEVLLYNNKYLYVNKSDMTRKLTPKEIEEFDIEIQSIKYNL